MSLMDCTFFHQHFADLGLQDCMNVIHVKAVNGSPLPIMGYVCLPLRVGRIEIPEVGFLVIKDRHKERNGMSVPILLGMNVLKYLPAVQTSVQLGVKDIKKGVIRTANDVPLVLQPNSCQLLELNPLLHNGEQTVSVDPLESFTSNKLMALGGICSSDQVVLRVFNFSPNPVTIQPHEPAAVVSSFDPLIERADIPEVSLVEDGSIGVSVNEVLTEQVPPLRLI